MTLSNNLAQGGQTFLHKIRMLRQVLWLSFRIGFFVAFIVFGWTVHRNVPSFVWKQVYTLSEANVYVWIFGESVEIKEGYSRVRAQDRVRDFRLNRNVSVLLPREILRAAAYALCTQLGIMLLAFILWSLRGRKAKSRKHLGGSRLIGVKKFRQILKKEKVASNITIGTLPMIKDSETQHMMITGTTGSGKTNCFHHLLPQIRTLGQRALIVDTTGEFVSRYYREGKDIILNPLDARSESWSPWVECTEDYHFEELASNLIPQGSQDPFWSNAARTIMAEALKIENQKKNKSLKELLKLLTQDDIKSLSIFFKDTPAFPLVDPSSERTASSIRATLSGSIQSLKYLEANTKPFSIRKWAQSNALKDQWLFISMTPDQRQALRPLVSAWTSVAIKSLISRPFDPTNRLWLAIDELPSLNKLSDLQLCLAEGRKYGAAMVLGIQNIPQLMEIYGMNITKTILDLCSTKVMFRAASQEIATYISQALGYQEIREVQEGISYGANDIRDGVNLSQVEKRKPVITPEDLTSLKNLEGYISLPGQPYITKLELEYKLPTVLSAPFIHRRELEEVQDQEIQLQEQQDS